MTNLNVTSDDQTNPLIGHSEAAMEDDTCPDVFIFSIIAMFVGRMIWNFVILQALCKHGGCENSGSPKSSILIRFSIINHPFWGTPIFGNTRMVVVKQWQHSF